MVKMSKDKAKTILTNVPEDKVFWVNDGNILRNLRDLPGVLANMGAETFKHHVNKEKNDFKNWIGGVIGDSKLAKDISKTQNQKTMANKINKRVSQITKIIK